VDLLALYVQILSLFLLLFFLEAYACKYIQVIPPYRVTARSFRPEWNMKPRESEDLVFCHNDLSTHNVVVDPETLKVMAVLDWEYAGYYPMKFEGMFFRRPGPSVALEGEANDEDYIIETMLGNEAPNEGVS
jgi:hypothetical protein